MKPAFSLHYLAVLAVIVLTACGDGSGGNTSTGTGISAPLAPTGITAVKGNAQATVSWTAAVGATSYNVYYRNTAGVTIANGTKVAGSTSAGAVTGLTNGTTYYFAVTAVNAAGESAVSSEVNAMPQAPVPAAPTGVGASAGNGQATISWTAVTGAVSYNVYYTATAGVTTGNGTKVTGATSGGTVTGLTNGTTYYFVVTAVNATGESVVSSEASATPQVSAPISPSGITVTAGDHGVVLTWAAVAGAASYNVYYGTSPGITTANGTLIAGALAGHAVLGLSNGMTYYFVVAAVNAGGESNLGAEVSVLLSPIARKTPKPKSLGLVYQNLTAPERNAFQETDMFGTIKMGGIWVSALPYADYISTVDTFCAYAVSTNQKALIQLPVALKTQMDDILMHLKSTSCNLEGVSVDNEPSRLTIELPSLFTSYIVNDYINDVNEIAPKIRAYLPDVYIIGLDLISFTPVEGADPISGWLTPFCSAMSGTTNVDYVSIHYYAYNGAQKEWRNYELGKQIKGYFSAASPLVPANCPPVILGEFNTTFQYKADTVYPGSGGESFMAALAVPEIFSIDRIVSLLHYSMVESSPSTLGLYDMNTGAFKPFHNSYRMLSSINGGTFIDTATTGEDIAVTSFINSGTYYVYLANYSPFFKRNLTVSNTSASAIHIIGANAMLETTLSLPPFSLTKLTAPFGQQGTITGRFAYADRSLKTGGFTPAETASEYCSVLADFAEPNLTGSGYFVGPISTPWNQNEKINSGGSYSFTSSNALVSHSDTGASSYSTINTASGTLNVDCISTAAASTAYSCGVKLPFLEDNASQSWKNWQSGAAKGFFRITLETAAPLTITFELRDDNPAALLYDTHKATRPIISGTQEVDVMMGDFKQGGWGTAIDVATLLARASSLSIGVAGTGTGSPSFKIHKVQICDKL